MAPFPHRIVDHRYIPQAAFNLLVSKFVYTLVMLRNIWASAMVVIKRPRSARPGPSPQSRSGERALAITDSKNERRHLSYPAWIERGRGLDPIQCQIQDVSEEGDAKPGRHCLVTQRLPDGVGVQFVRFLKDGNAATAIEYGLIATGIAVAVLPVITGLGTHLKSTFTTISSALK